MRLLLSIIVFILIHPIVYTQEDSTSVIIEQEIVDSLDYNNNYETEETEEESETVIDFMVSPTLGFNLQSTSYERGEETISAQWLGSLRAKLDIYGDVYNFNSSVTAQYGQIISKDEIPITTQDNLIMSIMPSMSLFEKLQLRLFLDNVIQTSMDNNDNYGNPISFLDPAYLYHTLFIGQDYKWENDDYTSSFNIIYGVGYAVQQTYTDKYILEENKDFIIDDDNPLSDVQSHFTLETGYSGILKFTYDTMISEDFSFYSDFSIAAITKDSFFEDVSKVSVNGIFFTALKYKYFSLQYSANMTYDEQIYSHRQLEQTLVFGFTHSFKF
jgi:hypothetical protein